MNARALLTLAVATATALHAETTIVVEAGDYDRRDTIVTFKLPPTAKPTSILLSDGQTAALQTDANGNAWFILGELPRGAKKTYTFGDGAVRIRAQTDTAKGELALSVAGKKAFTYHTAKTGFPPNRPDLKPIFHRAGYLHPVLTPGGTLVTDDYPANHKHHHGIWFSWSHALFEGRTNDYWNMGEGKGTMEFVALDQTWNGPVHAGFTSRHQHIDLTSGTPKPALNETWNIRLFAVGPDAARPYFLFDLDVTNACATTAPVKLPEYRYGGMCVRGNWAWNGKTNAHLLTSEGETNRARGDKNQVHARWAHLGGRVSGQFAGIAALAHPSNFRAPEPLRTNPAEPYFNFTPQQAGDLDITPDRPFVARYRWVVADGQPDRAELDRLWNDYAHPPVVRVSP